MIEIAALHETPLGPIRAAAGEHGLLAISLWDDDEGFAAGVAASAGQPVGASRGQTIAEEALRQIAEYLGGRRQTFDLALDHAGQSSFQRRVLALVEQVPYGETTTYRAIAKQLGQPGAVRAVGRANADNPLPIVIPCHRVLGADGKLHGYSAPGGLETKAFLLRLEGSWLL